MVERTLSASSSAEYKKIIAVLKGNAGRIIETWARDSSKASMQKGVDLNVPEETKVERLKAFYSALIAKAESPSSKDAVRTLRGAIRTEHARTASLSGIIKRQNLLKDTMLYVVEHDLPDLPRNTVKMALDAIVDRGIEATAEMMEEYGEMRAALSRFLPGEEGEVSLDQALARFCRSAMDYFDADFVALFRYVPEMKDLVCEACSAKGIALTKDSRVMLDSIPAAAQAIAQKKAIYVSDGEGATPKKKKAPGRLTFTHTICAPMLKGERVIGVFLLGDSVKSVPFTQDEVGLADDLSSQVSMILGNSELYKSLTVRSRAQKVLIDTAASLQQEIESEEIYRIVATRLSELVQCNELAFYVFDWKKNVCNPVFATGPYAAETMADRDFPPNSGIVGWVGRTRKAEIVMDVELDQRAEAIPNTPATHTRMLAVPVIGQKEVIGVIELLRYSPEIFTQEDLEVATLFANHASVALENAKLVSELTTVRDQIELHMDLLTHDIANYATPIMAYFETLSKRRDLDSELSTVVERTSRQAESILRLIEMVRTISKLREEPSKHLKKMDLKRAIESAISDVHKFSEARRLTIDVSLPDEVMLVSADDMLKDIFVNLLCSIALTEQRESSTLQITAEERKERKMLFWWIKVSQPSRAIPPNLKGDVLRMVKSSKSELTGGFGIGMAAAKGIVDKYAGSMWVGDIVPGDYTKGCVFNMLLPKAL